MQTLDFTRTPFARRCATVALALSLLATAAQLSADEASTTATAELERRVGYLASEELGGRLTGTEDEREAADFLARELTALGARPLQGEHDFLLGFEFTAGSRDGGSSISVGSAGDAPSWADTAHVRALSFSDSGEVTAPVVFAGYGLVVPEGQEFGYDSYHGLDVEGKIVLILRYLPEDVDQETRNALNRYSGLRYKAMQARERGAAALLIATGPSSPNAGETIAMTSDTAISGSGIVAASVSADVAATLFAALPDESLESAQEALDSGNPHIAGFPLEVDASIATVVERERKTGHNVAAFLPRTSAGKSVDKPYLVLGAHYDHLGYGDGGNSLARKDETGQAHLGADDNASGVAAVLGIAEELAERDRDRDVVLAFWSGEELGLLGATEFLKEPPVATDQMLAYVNFDMVGRSRDNKLVLQAIGSSSEWPSIVERANVPVGFDLQLQDDPYLPTDSTAFNGAEVPTLNFFTGSHEDYHRPTDVAASINYEDLERVVDLGARIAGRLASLEEPLEFVKVAPTRDQGADRDTVRAYTGTIPDYTTEVEGLKLSGVVEGGPAEEAGIQGGDVIVEFAGQSITNIYDYTYALDAVKVDVPVKVVVLRGDERIEITLTPRARK